MTPLLFLTFSLATSMHAATQTAKELLDQVYKDLSGFNIKAKESDAIFKAGGDPTYGEITYEGLDTLLKEIKPSSRDVFYDLGCGIGKTCAQALLTTPIKKSVGVELSHSRIVQAQKAAKEITPKLKKKTLQFREENITTTNLDDATILFMASLCFSDELMKQLTEKISGLKPGIRAISLRPLTEPHPFRLDKELTIPMSWSDTTSVYLYTLMPKKNDKKSARQH